MKHIPNIFIKFDFVCNLEKAINFEGIALDSIDHTLINQNIEIRVSIKKSNYKI